MSTSLLEQQALLQLTSHALVITDRDGCIERWNRGAELLCGWPASEARGQCFADLLTSGRDAAFLTTTLHQALVDEHGRGAGWITVQGGTPRWVEIATTALKDAGAPLGFVHVLQDRTDQLIAEERVRLAQEVGRVGTFELLPGEARLLVSSGFCQLWGLPVRRSYPLEELVRQLHPDDVSSLRTLTAAPDDDALDYLEYRIRRADTGEERWLGRRGQLMTSQGGGRYLGVCYDITERKLNEAAITERDLWLQELYHGMREGFYMAQAIRDAGGRMEDFRFLEVNPVFATLTGIPLDQVLGRTLRESLPQLEADLLPAYVDFMNGDAEFTQFDILLHLQHGHWYEVRAHKLPGDRFAVLFIDISNHRRQAQELARNEAQLRAIINSIDQMVWATRPDGHHFYFNNRWYEFTGVPEGSTEGEGWANVFHPDDQERTWKVWHHSLSTGEPYHIEYRLRHRSGRYRWVLGRAQPVRDAKGRIEQWFGTCTDIQSIVDAREVLTRSRQELEQQIELRTRERDRMWRISHDLMVICRPDGEVKTVNSAATRLLGRRETDLATVQLTELIHPDDQRQVFDTLRCLGRQQGSANLRARLRGRDGSYRILDWTASAEDELIYAVGRDVTEQQELQEQLRQAQKMEAVGQLTSGIAHDFNNLLTGIMGSLDMLQRHQKAGRQDKFDQYLHSALTSAQRAAALTQRLLAFSRRQALDLQPIHVNDCVRSMEELLLRSLRGDIALQLELDAGLWQALTDAHQLESALLNLVINARDALPHGGTIRIETRNVYLTDSGNGLDAVSAGDYVALLVADNGTGMPPEVMARAFDPFFTTKPIGQGTGLGLSMIYGYAKQSKGHVRLDSLPGQGTTVGLYLPRYLGADVEPPRLASPTVTAHSAGKTVLVVEDEPVVRQMVVDLLRELGYATLQAEDARSALPLLESGRPIDLLLSDVGLPGMNGRQLAEIARQRRPGLKVLFATGYAEGAHLEGYLDPGMTLITKPFNLDALATRVGETLAADPLPLSSAAVGPQDGDN
ncbi:MAG: hybrid sensor histidine kinase/response regulator [Pseudomonas sp. PGPPP4]|uniref:hybrid sensor histidine kinase/response regulator n=1 Tax=Pseudomonas sp. PGPPP4 TaxID=2015556 RepID=UPI000BD391E1|nr:hybrid sensor histidine kinase/response regulator [Pseudomonas sp. PGPPP4]OYT81092.1 MAG: hybrid sensor histidine kinase/response regulator [Pseudomonas sp. PGPPP4]